MTTDREPITSEKGKRGLPDRYTPLKADADTLRAMARMEADGSDEPDDLRGIRARTLLGAAIQLERKIETEETILEDAIDRMGWPEIHAFQEELQRGQGVCEDAGGFFMRAIRRLFGRPKMEGVVTYQEAARALVKEALEQKRKDSSHGL